MRHRGLHRCRSRHGCIGNPFFPFVGVKRIGVVQVMFPLGHRIYLRRHEAAKLDSLVGPTLLGALYHGYRLDD